MSSQESLLTLPEIRDSNCLAKIIDLDSASALAQYYRAHSLVIGLIHGAFDPPHTGHQRLIASIKPFCDILFVGVDGDHWLAARHKIYPGPKTPELWRTTVLATQTQCNYVFPLAKDRYDSSDFTKIYQQLGVTVLGCGEHNPLLPRYQQDMATLNGTVYTVRETTHSAELFGNLNPTETDLFLATVTHQTQLIEQYLATVRRR